MVTVTVTAVAVGRYIYDSQDRIVSFRQMIAILRLYNTSGNNDDDFDDHHPQELLCLLWEMLLDLDSKLDVVVVTKTTA